jgi:hypothetical protein
MDHKDVLTYLARSNGKTFFPLMDEDIAKELDIPYFQISKNHRGGGYCGYDMKYYNFETHDNAPRMPYYGDYILKNVLPNLDKNSDASGFYPIELHDAISYLHNDKDYDNALTFAKKKIDHFPVLIPDPFMIGNYGGRLNAEDNFSWNKKIDKCAFYGVTTGNRAPLQNSRLKLCKWAIDHREICDFYISGIVQMNVDDVVRAYGEDVTRKIVHQPMPQTEQYKYKYLLSIDGNTCSYDRMCWVMKSNSLCLKYPSEDILWYYPLLHDKTHFVSCHEPNFSSVINYYNNNMKETNLIIDNAKKFVNTYTNPVSAIMYTTFLFETFIDNK